MSDTKNKTNGMWKETILSEIITLIGGGTPKTKVSDYWNGHIPWLSVVDFNTGKKFVFDAEKKITQKGLKNSSTKLLEKGQIIISARGTVGVVAMLGRQMAFNQSCYGIRANEKSTNDYVYYLLKDRVSNFQQVAHGAVFDTITRNTFKNIKIPLPPLPEQRAIASVLSSLDDKIDLLHRQNKTLEEMAETLFREWFIERAEEDWEKCKVEDLCEKVNSGGTPSTKAEEYYNGDINWFSTKELNDNFLFESLSKISQIGLDNSSAKLFPKGTILIAIYAAPTVGRLGILGKEAAFNQAACGLMVNDKLCSKEFLYLYLKHQREELNAMASGSAQQNLNVKKIKTFPAFIPDEETKNKFTNISVPVFKKMEINEIQIHTLSHLRDTLLPKLMSGEVRVNPIKVYAKSDIIS